MRRVLAGLHALGAAAAFGIGNAAFAGAWDSPTLVHLAFGVSLLATAVAVWRGVGAARWFVLVNLVVGTAVAAVTVLDPLIGNTATPAILTAGAVAFVLLELLTLRVLTRHPVQDGTSAA